MKKTILLSFLMLSIYVSKAQFILDLESGAAKFGYNDVRFPGAGGTKFSLANTFENKPTAFFRARLQYNINRRHTVSALYAPLTINGSGAPNTDITFGGRVFEAGSSTKTTWQFNSYRLTYQYNIISNERFLFALGVTGKVRDAKIAISNSEGSAQTTNVGVVPLVRFYADLCVGYRLNLIVDGDALVGPQGRAEDVLFAIGYHPIDRLRLKLGYRLLEGGADNDEVYNFSSVHYAVVGAAWSF